MKTIMLVCQAGMSTSILVSKIKEAVKERNLEVDVFAVGTSQADSYIKDRELDVILLGPQIRFMKEEFQDKVKNSDTIVEVIDMVDYGNMDGEKVLEKALSLDVKK